MPLPSRASLAAIGAACWLALELRPFAREPSGYDIFGFNVL